MKAVIVFMLLFAAVYCHPVKRSASSSESADVQPVDTQALKVSAVADVSSEEDADDNDNDSDSDESDETGPTSSPPFFETTIIPNIDGRGDSMGYPGDYKKPVYYVDGNNIEKGPSSYKSYSSDKTEYDGVNLKVYKALQVQNVGLDQGTDASSGTDSEDTIPQEPKAASSTSSASDASPSQESNEDSQSSEEATTGATTTDSNSSESSESKEINASSQPGTLKSKNPEVIA